MKISGVGSRSVMNNIHMSRSIRSAKMRAQMRSRAITKNNATTDSRPLKRQSQTSGTKKSQMQNGSSQEKVTDTSSKTSLHKNQTASMAGQKTDKTASELTKENRILKQTKSAASDIRKRANNLVDSGKDSLIGRASRLGNTTGVVAEIGLFVSDFNCMMDNMKEVSTTVSDGVRKEFCAYEKKYQPELQKIGLTVNQDGTLNTNQKKLNEAGLEELKNVFSGTGSFGEKVFSKSIYVETSCLSQINKNKYAIPNAKNTVDGTGNTADNKASGMIQNFLKRFLG